MPIRGGGVAPRRSPSCRPTAHAVSAAGVGADDHHLVAERLDHARVERQRLLDRLDEALDRRSPPPRRPARRSGARSRRGRRTRSPRAGAPPRACSSVEVGLHVADHVLLDEVREQAPVQVGHERRRERQQLARQRPPSPRRSRRSGTPARISGSCTYRWIRRTSASAIWAIACPYTRASCRKAAGGKPAVEHRGGVAQHLRSSSEIASSGSALEAHRGVRSARSAPLRARLARGLRERVARPRSRCSRFSIGPIASWPLSLAA